METKRCTKCGVEKELGEFSTVFIYGKLNYYRKCKECCRKTNETWYQKKYPELRPREGRRVCIQCCLDKSIDQFSKNRNGFLTRCRQCTGINKLNKRKEKFLVITKDGIQTCRRCHKSKPTSSFKVTYRSKIGAYDGICLECRREQYFINYFKRHPEKKCDVGFQICNRCGVEKPLNDYAIRKNRKTYYKICIKCTNDYHMLNKDKNYNKEYGKSHRDYFNKYSKDKYANDLNFKLSIVISNAVRLSLKTGKQGHRWEYLVGYAVEDLVKHLKSKFTDGMTFENYGDYNGNASGWHIDHIRPVSSFNITSYDCEDFKKCWSLENLQPLWATTRTINGIEYLGNMNKHAKIISNIQR